MAIIYSYSKTNEIYGSDLLVLSRFHNSSNVDNGRNYSLDIGTLGEFISENYGSTLNTVLTAGNSSLLDAKIGKLYLYDIAETNYGSLSITDTGLDVFGVNNTFICRIDKGGLSISNGTYGSAILTGVTTANRNYNLQDKSGTIALTSDIPTTTNYGLFAQTANSTPVTTTTVETTLINGGVGTLTVPANAFKVGDSFRAVFGGVLNAGNNQTIRIRVKSGSVVLLDSGAQPVTNITNNIFSLNIDFTVRQLGTAGVASIVSLGSFHYKKTSNATVEGFAFNTINNTTFDTTIGNTLDVTVQWGSNNANNSIYSDIFVLNKTY
jgi:hypothetical protein